jgi:hypothetical protein
MEVGKRRRDSFDVRVGRRLFRGLGAHWRDSLLSFVPQLAAEVLAAGEEPQAIEAALDRALRGRLSELADRPLPPELAEQAADEEHAA